MCMNAQYLCRDILRQYVTDDDVERSAKRKDLFFETPTENRFFSNECVFGRKEAILEPS